MAQNKLNQWTITLLGVEDNILTWIEAVGIFGGDWEPKGKTSEYALALEDW